MFCFCCKSKQISPSDSVESSLKLTHKFIKLKQNKLIHLTHVNENNEKTSVNGKDPLPFYNSINSTAISFEQPKRTNSPAIDPFNTLDENNTSQSEDTIRQTDTSAGSIETFTNLLASPKFKQRDQKYLCVKDGSDSFGFSILYKNKIKITSGLGHSVLNKIPLDNTASLSNESHCAPSNLNNKLPVLFYIHGVGGCSMIF